MKTALIFALLISGCATNGGGSFLDPVKVAGNETYVTYYDNIGMPGRVEQMAKKYCSGYAKLTQFQSMGGNYFMCTGRDFTMCSTYLCVDYKAR